VTQPAKLTEPLGTRRTVRVRVWFGQHVIADYLAEPETAGRYALAMSRRFAGLNVTLDRHHDGSTSVDEAKADRGPDPLPSERLWELTP